MANRIPCYYLTPTWDCPPPPRGPIKLGSVIASLDAPERPLFTPSLSTDQDETGQIFSTEQRQVAFSTDKLRQGQFGIFTRFLVLVLGMEVEARVKWEKGDASLFTFDTLETTQLTTTPQLTQSCISAPAVRRFLDKSRYRKPVYIITGIKTARGAHARTLVTRSAGTSFKVGSDGTLLSAPIGVGPFGEEERSSSQGMEWTGGNDFVFAFRVREVVVKRRTGLVERERDYLKGAVLDKGAAGGDLPALEIVSEDEVDFASQGREYEELREGDEVVRCAKLV